MKVLAYRTVLVAALAGSCGTALAWGPNGHHTVGAMADRLLQGSHAAAEAATLLNGVTLQDAAVWADCAKGIDPAKNFAYTSAGRFPECRAFETPDGIAEMADFVRRNDTNCARQPTDESCHKSYHYTDEAIQRSRYRRGDFGTRDFDIVAAASAATQVLAGGTAPAPFAIKDKREALLLLAHYLGDIHQPLHVGAVYLDAQGRRVDPDAGTPDPLTETRGGNQIVTINPATNRRSANLHQTWDDLPKALFPEKIDAAWLAQARRVSKTAGVPADWPAPWAGETLIRARTAFAGLAFGPEEADVWPVELSCAYNTAMAPLKRKQLTAAGARLAQLLRAVWP